MVNFCDYNIAVVKMQKLHTVKDYREYAEQMVARFGYRRIVRFGVVTNKKKLFFGTRENRQYSKAKATYFDDVAISDIYKLGFDATSVKGSYITNFFLHFVFQHETGLVYIYLVLDSADQLDSCNFSHAEQFLEALQEIATVRFVQADRMDSEKWVNAFTSGIGQKPRRNDFENRVASSISKCQQFHHQPPFLFAYNYVNTDLDLTPVNPEYVSIENCKGYSKLLFPCCLGKTLDDYPTIPEWASVYESLKSQGIIKIEDKLASMVEDIIAEPKLIT